MPVVGKRPLERPKHKWNDGIKINVKNVVAIHLTQYRGK
jgi:hypothetical protein